MFLQKLTFVKKKKEKKFSDIILKVKLTTYYNGTGINIASKLKYPQNIIFKD